MGYPTVDVLIFVEHAARELETVCLVKHFLETRHGLSVLLAHSSFGSHDLLSRLCPRVCCTPQFRLSARQSISYWWDNIGVVNLAWEQILSKVNRAANAPKDEFARRHVHYLAWGRAHQGFLAECGVPAAHLHVVGSPNFGLLDERYRFLSRDRETLARLHRLDPAKRWIFFPENYGWAFITNGQIEDRIRSGYYTRQQAHEYRDFQQRNLRRAVEWICRVCESTDVEFILRPRPVVPAERFEEAFEGRVPAKVSIIKSGSAREWLLAADGVISNYSTVLVDAAAAGKPAFNLRAEPIPDSLNAEFLHRAPALTSAEELIAACRGDLTETSAALRDYAFANFSSRGDPFQRMADVIAEVRRRQVKSPRFLHGRGWYRFDRSWRGLLPMSMRLAVNRMLGRLPSRANPVPLPEMPILSGDNAVVDQALEVQSRIREHLCASPSSQPAAVAIG